MVQGGPSFDVFTPCVARYLATGQIVAPDIEEIGDYEVRETLLKVSYIYFVTEHTEHMLVMRGIEEVR